MGTPGGETFKVSAAYSVVGECRMPVKSDDLCSAAYCRKPMSIVALGKPLCDEHEGERVERAYQEAVARLRTEGSNTAGVIVKQVNGRRVQ